MDATLTVKPDGDVIECCYNDLATLVDDCSEKFDPMLWTVSINELHCQSSKVTELS